MSELNEQFLPIYPKPDPLHHYNLPVSTSDQIFFARGSLSNQQFASEFVFSSRGPTGRFYALYNREESATERVGSFSNRLDDDEVDTWGSSFVSEEDGDSVPLGGESTDSNNFRFYRASVEAPEDAGFRTVTNVTGSGWLLSIWSHTGQNITLRVTIDGTSYTTTPARRRGSMGTTDRNAFEAPSPDMDDTTRAITFSNVHHSGVRFNSSLRIEASSASDAEFGTNVAADYVFENELFQTGFNT